MGHEVDVQATIDVETSGRSIEIYAVIAGINHPAQTQTRHAHPSRPTSPSLIV